MASVYLFLRGHKLSLSGVRWYCHLFLQLMKLRKAFTSPASTLFSVVCVRRGSAKSLTYFPQVTFTYRAAPTSPAACAFGIGFLEASVVEPVKIFKSLGRRMEPLADNWRLPGCCGGGTLRLEPALEEFFSLSVRK